MGDTIDIGVMGADEVPLRAMCDELWERATSPTGGGAAMCVLFGAMRPPGANSSANGGGVGPGGASVLNTVSTGELLAGE